MIKNIMQPIPSFLTGIEFLAISASHDIGHIGSEFPLMGATAPGAAGCTVKQVSSTDEAEYMGFPRRVHLLSEFLIHPVMNFL